jgi:hypothetical protein
LLLASWMNYFIIREAIGPGSSVVTWLTVHTLLRAAVMAITAFILRGYESADRKRFVEQRRHWVRIRDPADCLPVAH